MAEGSGWVEGVCGRRAQFACSKEAVKGHTESCPQHPLVVGGEGWGVMQGSFEVSEELDCDGEAGPGCGAL